MSHLNNIIDAIDMGEYERLTVSTDVSIEIKLSDAMLKYGEVTETGIKFLGMEVVINHNLPDGKWYLK